MSTSTTSTFWRDAAERAAKSAIQGLLSSWLVGTTAEKFNLFDTDLLTSLKLALSMLVLSFLFSLVSKPIGSDGTASLTNAVKPNLTVG